MPLSQRALSRRPHLQPCVETFLPYQGLTFDMKLLRVPLLLLLLGLVSTLLTGCFTTRKEEDSSMPWSRPAGWEGQVPGMGTPQGSGTR